jgi:YHS domain-containing protein
VVSGKLFGADGPVAATYKGRNIYFYDEKCRAAFEANPEPYVKKYDQAMVKVQSNVYPLDHCIVSGTKFSDEVPPVDYVYNSRLVRFCCPSYIAKFKENPPKYLAALDKAVIEQQSAGYPLESCVVTGQKLGGMGEPYNHVWANQLVKFCCKGCIPQFNKDPRKYMVKVYAEMPHPGKDAGSTSTVAPAVKGKKDCGSPCGSKGSCGDKDSGTSTVVPAAKSKKSCGSPCGSSCGGK